MAPSGLVITKLAAQISADDELAHTLLCLKISLPRDVDHKQTGRWVLLSSGGHRLVSEPQIHSLPLAPTIVFQADQIRTAALLLSLSPESSKSLDQPGTLPAIDIDAASGQVYISVDHPAPRRRRESVALASPGVSGGRREFLVVLELEQDVEDAGGWLKLNLTTPKCLDNILRFQCLPPRASSSTSNGEVSIVTEPKILPVPASTFSPSSKSRPTRARKVEEDEWEDGESLGPEDIDSDSSEEEGSGNWLEGRFQSTESLRLEWSFGSTLSAIPSLHLTPKWDTRHPYIEVDYQATLSPGSYQPFEVELPNGWGWSDLQIEGDGLAAWYCRDSDWWDPLLCAASPAADPNLSDTTDRPDEDSFATVRARKNLPLARTLPSLSRSSSGASLMRQPLPQPDPSFDEFSFELSNAPAPVTPASLRKNALLSRSVDKAPLAVSLARPAPGRSFELVFAEDTEEANIRISGKLVPLSRNLLVSPSVPIAVPVFHIGEHTAQCHLTYPNAAAQLIGTQSSPTFSWPDVPSHRPLPVQGEIATSLPFPTTSASTMTVSFPWPKPATEVGFFFASAADAADGVKIAKATMRGRALPRAAVLRKDGVEVRIGKGEGGVEGACVVVLEIPSEGVELPVFPEATGRMTVDLAGWKWETVAIHSNLIRDTATSYSAILPIAHPYLTYTHHTPTMEQAQPAKSGPYRAIWSWSTLINIFMLYLLLSLAQQLQRMRTEVAFITEETKDLRLYHTWNEERLREAAYTPRWEQGADVGREDTTVQGPGRKVAEKLDHMGDDLKWDRGQGGAWDRDQQDTSLGRVVVGHTDWVWARWVRHPTVHTLSKSLGWIWHSLVWTLTR